MNEDRLIAVSYDFTDRTATFAYKEKSEYDLAEIAQYVDDMSDGRAVRINILQIGSATLQLYRKADGSWGGVDGVPKHVV
jgi:hypothetical protein